MIAFVKRRWFLLSCAVVLLVCGSVDFNTDAPQNYGFNDEALFLGSKGGNLYFIRGNPMVVVAYAALFALSDSGGFHAPMVGDSPRVNWQQTYILLKVPIYVPLAAILCGIVVRELRRWRKRAGVASASAEA